MWLESKMIGLKFLIKLLIVLCDSKNSLVPPAILQLVKSHYGESLATIRVYDNIDRSKILDKTVELWSEVKNVIYRQLTEQAFGCSDEGPFSACARFAPYSGFQ